MAYFVVIRARGPAWDWSRPMRRQDDWPAHAAFMDALVGEGFIILGGPLGGEDNARRVMHVVSAPDRAAVETRLTEDPWKNDMLVTLSIEPWTVLLGEIEGRR